MFNKISISAHFMTQPQQQAVCKLEVTQRLGIQSFLNPTPEHHPGSHELAAKEYIEVRAPVATTNKIYRV